MPDWALVAIIGVVVIFGASKLPEIALNLGRSSGEFKKGLKEGADQPAGTTTSDGAVPPAAPPTDPARDEARTDPTAS